MDEVVFCGGGVGCGDGFDFVGGEGGVDIPGSGFPSAVASGSEVGTTRGRPSGNTLAACG
jgi:hypothetical protein